MAVTKPIYIAVIGTGGVGAQFLLQLHHLSLKHSQLKLIVVTRSSKGISTTPSDPSIPIDKWESLLSASTHPGLSPSSVLSVLLYHKSPSRSILIDNTSDATIAESYPSFLQAGISVVTPNKKAFSSSLSLWKDIFSSSLNPPPSYPPTQETAHIPQKGKGGFIYHEATVGAGLPILNTLTDLLATEDKIHKIEGVFSGTMSYLFNTFAPAHSDPSGSKPPPKWSEAVRVAKEGGFTEPDPRDDLNGADVARKLVILARLIGPPLPYVEGIDSFPVQSLIPPELASPDLSTSDFLAQLPKFDTRMEDIKKSAKAKGKIIRFVGRIDVDKREVKVGMEEFDKDAPVAGLKHTDNIVSFHTERYKERPLVVQGGGAGGEVTAMGVTADLLRIIHRMGD